MRTLNIESNHSSVLRGITVTEVLVAIAILAILFLLLMPAVQQSRESARRLGCSTNLKQIGTAIENYHASYRVYPGAFVRWPHELLPYLEQTPLHKKLQVLHQNRLARIEDRELIEEVHSASVPIYVCPSDSYAAKYHGWNISYRMNDGYWPPKNKFNGFFQVYTGRDISNIGFDFRQTRSADMTDGQSNTAALSEMLVHPNIADLVGMLPPADHPQIWRRTIRETWWVDGPDALDEFCRRCEFEPITPSQSILFSGQSLSRFVKFRVWTRTASKSKQLLERNPATCLLERDNSVEHASRWSESAAGRRVSQICG